MSTPVVRLTRIPRTIRNLGRFRDIVSVLAKYGFEELVLRLGMEGMVLQSRRLLRLRLRGEEQVWERVPVEERIRRIFEELGPTYIKFGQILATRPDLIPMSMVTELRKLQDAVPPFSSAEARASVERELGRPLQELFAEFEDRPIAAASIGQVHGAVLPGGQEVVVKVQRPGIRSRIANDLDILRLIADLLDENVPEVRRYDPRGLVEQFARAINQELDYRREAFHIQKFTRNFADVDYVNAPEVCTALSTDRVLVMERVGGLKANDIAGLDAAGCDRKLLAQRGTQALLKMIFVDGFFHADPHPGNVFIRTDNTICFIDFGMMGQVDQERIDELLLFLIGLLTNDMDRIVELFTRMELLRDDTDVRRLKLEMQSLLDRYGSLPLADVDLGVFIAEVFDTIQEHDVTIPSDLMLMGKALATMEGIAQELWPAYDPLTEMRGYLLRIYTNRLTDPRYLARGIYDIVDEYVQMAGRLPRELESIVAKLRKGELTVKVDDPRGRREQLRQSRALNNLAIAAATAAIGMSSTALLLVPLGPLTFGLHATTLLGLAGYGLTWAMGSVLMYSVAVTNRE